MIPTLSYLDEKGILSPLCKDVISDLDLVKGYRTMLLTRLVDERMITLQRQGTISFAMSARGEEACSVASAAALQPADWMYPQYREAGILFWRGFTIAQYVDLMFCNAKDLSAGRQMPNHFGCRELNVVTVSSPIGTKIPHAAGCAYAMKMQKEQSVAICYFGEGASSEGDFHVGVNFGAVTKAPVIFFCRNNGYAISTPASKQYACDGVASKGIGYGIPSFKIDGNDFFAVHETVAKARELCLNGKGPVLIEAMTYRLGAHSTADDPSVYRKDEEVALWEKKCPILRLRQYLEKKGLWNQQEEDGFIKEVSQEITAAIATAKEEPPPPLQSLFEHVYFEMPQSLREQYQEARSLSQME
jgi:2-oxoisovalerate dehydrogenase E1 component alpha subunit